MPWLGLAAGAAAGGLAGKLVDDKLLDFGVDNKFIKDVGNTIEPGHSALFLLVVEAKADEVEEELKGTNATVLQTSLSKEQEAKLRDMFAADDIEA